MATSKASLIVTTEGMDVSHLAAKWNRTSLTSAACVTVVEGTGKLPCVKLQHANGSKTTVYLHGATLTEYVTDSGDSVVMLSKEAVFDGAKAIRGGVPVCWPQFSTLGPLQQNHGFARNQTWSIVAATAEEGVVSVDLELRDNDKTRALWNNAFRLLLKVQLFADSLDMAMVVSNLNGTNDFTFTAALHTYYRVSDVTQAYISGLKGLTYVDKVQEGKQCVEESTQVVVNQEIDRIYVNAPPEIVIHDSRRDVVLTRKNFSDVVVWNPWVVKAKGMADFADEEYKVMVCAESAQITSPISLKPSQQWKASQAIKCRSTSNL